MILNDHIGQWCFVHFQLPCCSLLCWIKRNVISSLCDLRYLVIRWSWSSFNHWEGKCCVQELVSEDALWNTELFPFSLALSLASQVAIPVASVRIVKKHKTAGLVPNGLAITTDSSQKVRFHWVPGHRPADWNTKLSQHMRCCKTLEMQMDATLRLQVTVWVLDFSQHLSHIKYLFV